MSLGNRAAIKFVLSDPYGAQAYLKISKWSGSSLLPNLSEFEVYGGDRDVDYRKALDWICRNWGEPNKTDNHIALEKRPQLRMYYLSIPDVNSWGYKQSKFSNMGVDEREIERGKSEAKSLAIFTLMNLFGHRLTIFKRLNTDLNDCYTGFSTVKELLDMLPRFKTDFPKSRFFYFKQGSKYYLYHVSPRYWNSVMQVVNYLGIPIKEV